MSLYLGQLFMYAHACRDEFHAFLRQAFASGFCFPNTSDPVPCYVSPSKYSPTKEEIAAARAPFRVLHVAGRDERYISIDVPVKKLERARAKIEFDYAEEAPPRSAKVLDLLRGSVTFDDPRGLVAGYHHFRALLDSDPYVALGRVKNGHRRWDLGGYVDLKVNFIFVSREDPLHRQICELQFILKPLHVLKESVCHRQYEVIRRAPFWDMVVADEEPAMEQGGGERGAPPAAGHALEGGPAEGGTRRARFGPRSLASVVSLVRHRQRSSRSPAASKEETGQSIELGNRLHRGQGFVENPMMQGAREIEDQSGGAHRTG